MLAIGSVAASLIPWLSVSFWIDAWRQRENARELRRVVALGCDQVQGYHYSKPVPADEVPATIARVEATLAAAGRRAA